MESMGVVVRRYNYIDFLILLIPTPLVSVLFCSIMYFVYFNVFCSFLKCFSFLFRCFFVIKFYVLNNVFAQYKHTYGNYGRPTAAI